MHPIIALWAHPRSMSTAMERVMRERGDLICLHEPFMYDYYVARKVRIMPHFEPDPGEPVTFADIRDHILTRAEEGPVFLKDMGYYVLPFLESDAAFFTRMRHGFIIRDPRAAILSYHKLDPKLSSEEIGIAGQWALFQWLESQGIAGHVISAEAARAEPERIIGAFWEHAGLDPKPEAFTFTDKTEMPDQWQSVSSWHAAVTNSTGIRPADPGEAAQKRAAFDAAAEKEPRLAELLADHLEAYEALLERANTHQ